MTSAIAAHEGARIYMINKPVLIVSAPNAGGKLPPDVAGQIALQFLCDSGDPGSSTALFARLFLQSILNVVLKKGLRTAKIVKHRISTDTTWRPNTISAPLCSNTPFLQKYIPSNPDATGTTRIHVLTARNNSTEGACLLSPYIDHSRLLYPVDVIANTTATSASTLQESNTDISVHDSFLIDRSFRRTPRQAALESGRLERQRKEH